MIANNLSQITFESYSSQAQNGFKPSKEEYLECQKVMQKVDEFYSSVNANQGIIGKTWDRIKNFLNLKTSSKNTEAELDKYNNDITNYSSEVNAVVAMNKYAKSQEMALGVVRNFVSSAVAGGIFSFGKKHLNILHGNKKIAAILAAATAVGGICGVGIKAIDAKSANRKYDKKEMAKDFALSSVQGIISGLSSFGISSCVGNELTAIPKMMLKGIVKFGINVGTILSTTFFETGLSFRMMKLINPKQYQTLVDKAKLQQEMDKYKFYNPRHDLKEDKDSLV